MNTIPLIFNEHQINRTVVPPSSPLKDVKMDVGVVLLNTKESYFRASILESLCKCGFSSIVSIETGLRNYNIEEVIKKFPEVKFVFLLEDATQGEMINIGALETNAAYFCVVKDTFNVQPHFLQRHVAEKIIASDDYCVVPRLVKKNNDNVSVVFFPAKEKGKFKIDISAKLEDGKETLYPFDFIAMYNRKKFIQLGGFDYTILSPYYQNLDLALRSWLWGEKTKVSTSFLISYEDEIPIEDITVDLTYLHFYLKNIMPRFKIGDGGFFPKFSFFKFLRKSPCGFFETQKIFSDGKQWVEKNKLRFQTDIYNLIAQWVV